MPTNKNLTNVQNQNPYEANDREVIYRAVGDVVGGVEPDRATVQVLDAVHVGEEGVRRGCFGSGELFQGCVGRGGVACYGVGPG